MHPLLACVVSMCWGRIRSVQAQHDQESWSVLVSESQVQRFRGENQNLLGHLTEKTSIAPFWLRGVVFLDFILLWHSFWGSRILVGVFWGSGLPTCLKLLGCGREAPALAHLYS